MNQKRFSAIALDPIHIGTGGERIGRVDSSVVREPVTNVPKIPGTSLSGALKFFLDLNLRDMGVKPKLQVCASTRGSDEKNRHEWNKCPVCYAFGFTAEEDQGNGQSVNLSNQGILQFIDAQLLAYPVNTMTGPVWVTTKSRVKDLLGVGDGKDDLDEKFALPSDSGISLPIPNKLNFGWVFLDKDTIAVPTSADIKAKGIEEKYAKRFIFVSEWLFSNLVNNNMEVRTSVVINPETGAAKKGGLFTHESVARGAIFVFEIVENDYKDGWKNVNWLDKPENAIKMIEQFAFPGIAAVGLGGMTTRGFGRLEIKPLLLN
jgi:CRISPR-associated protein Cmr4